jgi:hypothetical protein
MGTTLTGTTPQDTYDSLIKVTDNGPISGTLKALSDGLGNDSTLSLSTTAASIAGTLAVTGNVTIDTSTLVVDAANNRVGINKATPTTTLDVSGTFAASGAATLSSTLSVSGDTTLSGASGNRTLAIQTNTSGSPTLSLIAAGDDAAGITYNRGLGYLSVGVSSVSNAMVVTSAGNVGIGTARPAVIGAGNTSFDVAGTAGAGLIARGTSVVGELYASDAGGGVFISAKTNNPIILRTNDVERLRVTNDGLTFNGDTAAANALDDYEEGTWTMGVSFGGASVGVTTSQNTGTYTKIGRQVTVNGYLVLTSKGSSTGAALLTGLPFTIANTTGNYSAACLYLGSITFTNQFQGYGNVNTTNISLEEVTVLGISSVLTDADFANSSGVIVSLTYFV